ncbi:hypothetical protein GPL15_25210 [Clostridium sp. MCC353]|uniref:hypothetical protein n=1 Tax=Clostridium sp. MCC353 TaxID=2592646 RepID=UPI001C028BE4|nr:hypothetical protein [Clostridium sp. MCC353]MBT9779774.1 hypothetical protein [Clostridium sp. MCC353]
MKKILTITAALLIILSGCANHTSPPPQAETKNGTADGTIEKQLQIISDNYLWPPDHYSGTNHMYAVTDLDQNGRLELICSILQGSGRYTDSVYYEVKETLDGLEECPLENRELDSGADLVTESAPVYYDPEYCAYYFIFDDLIKDGMDLSYENKRAVSLADGKLTEQILAFKTTQYDEHSPISITCEDAIGRKITEVEYKGIADTEFGDLIKKEACFSWFSLSDLELEPLNKPALLNRLRQSYEGFLIQ